MSDQTQKRVPVLIASVDGSSASDNGEQIKVGLTASTGIQADVMMSIHEATSLVTHISLAMGEALRRRTANPNARWAYMARSWAIAPPQDDQLLTFSFGIQGGAELCFQLDRTGAAGFLEGLSVVLGVGQTATVPKSQTH